MLVLYEYLQLEPDATAEEIKKNYKVLAYKYLQEHDDIQLQNVNLAYQILKDPYKRRFYDRFGDQYISNLSNSTESYFISRFFTLFNMILILSCFLCLVSNYFFLGLIYLIWPASSKPFKFCLFILAPLLLIPVLIKTNFILSHQNSHYYKFIYSIFILLTISFSFLIISSEISIFAMLANEFAQLIFVYLLFSDLNLRMIKLMSIFLFKSCSFILYYADWAFIEYFIPCISILGTAIVNPFITIALIIVLLPKCLGIYLLEKTSYFKVSVCINIFYSFIGIIILILVTVLIASDSKKKFSKIKNLNPPAVTV